MPIDPANGLPESVTVRGLDGRRGRVLPPMPVEPGCEHETVTLVLHVMSNTARMFRLQCRTCGARSQFISHSSLTADEMRRAVPYDRAIAQDFRARRQAGVPPGTWQDLLLGWRVVHCKTDRPPPGMIASKVHSLDFVLDWVMRAHDRYEWRLVPVVLGDVDDPIFGV